jgi:hypothetical protein
VNKVLYFSGLVLILLNSLIGMIFSSYSTFNFVLTDFSILLSILLCYLVNQKITNSALRNASIFAFLITGLLRFLSGIFVDPQIMNDWVMLIFILILGFEVIIFILLSSLNNK